MIANRICYILFIWKLFILKSYKWFTILSVFLIIKILKKICNIKQTKNVIFSKKKKKFESKAVFI